ncbi:hypothetical protein PC110_g21052 [Phytophthora cactorum]|uniref:PiggyBac transposable element-derived protein domain-containing protein n=1 Tax=Phytophthora cactorum TaxID=29920 RepID=A0A329RFF3_9STRA|nr:hypothetical protein PC110_g21052 [Phytophthora cactorum]
MSVYESFSSGESDGEVLAEEDEDDVCRDRGDRGDANDVLSDSDAVQMDETFVASLQVGKGALDKRAMKQREDALRAMEWNPVSSAYEEGVLAYPGLNAEDARRLPFSASDVVLLHAKVHVGQDQRGDEPVRSPASRPPCAGDPIEAVGSSSRDAQPDSSTLEGEAGKRRFAVHWLMVEDGSVPAGTFGRFMGRNRCQDILRDLHFVDNEADRTRDKLWKLRPVVDKIQQRFLAGWSLPAVFSFDEGVLPSTSKRNTTRMFMPDKPHRYGSKMFIVCDSRTAYCHRFEMYAGKRDACDDGDASVDHKTGAAAVSET